MFASLVLIFLLSLEAGEAGDEHKNARQETQNDGVS